MEESVKEDYIKAGKIAAEVLEYGKSIIKKENREKSILYEPVESVAPFLYSWLNLDNLNIDFPDKEDILDEVY